MSTNAILPQVFVGTHSCTYMVQNREDCVGVSSHRPNWAASRVHALMLHEGSVRTPGGHFFTFADAGALSHDQAGHLRLRQLASPVRISVSPPINFHYCFQPPPELVWVRTVQPMRSSRGRPYVRRVLHGTNDSDSRNNWYHSPSAAS